MYSYFEMRALNSHQVIDRVMFGFTGVNILFI